MKSKFSLTLGQLNRALNNLALVLSLVNLRNQIGVAGFTIAKEFRCMIAIRGTKAFQQHDKNMINKFPFVSYEITKCSKNICQLVVFTKGAQNDLLNQPCHKCEPGPKTDHTLPTESTSQPSLQGQLSFNVFQEFQITSVLHPNHTFLTTGFITILYSLGQNLQVLEKGTVYLSFLQE